MKSACVAFQPKKSKLFCPNVTLDNNVLEYIGRTKYLCFMFNSNGQDIGIGYTRETVNNSLAKDVIWILVSV